MIASSSPVSDFKKRAEANLLQTVQEQVKNQLVEEAFPRTGQKSIMLEGEGVFEVWDTGRVDGSVQTDRGPMVFSGGTVADTHCEDIQSGTLRSPESTIDQVDDAIRAAYEHLNARDALRVIAAIWDRLDRSAELAAARSRLLLGKLPPPPLADLPERFKSQSLALVAPEEGEPGAHPLAVQAAEMLIRACTAALPEACRLGAELSMGALQRVLVDWHIPEGRLQWMVEASDLPWPAVKVYHVARRDNKGIKGRPDARILHNAFDVVEAFVRTAKNA